MNKAQKDNIMLKQAYFCLHSNWFNNTKLFLDV